MDTVQNENSMGVMSCEVDMYFLSIYIKLI